MVKIVSIHGRNSPPKEKIKKAPGLTSYHDHACLFLDWQEFKKEFSICQYLYHRYHGNGANEADAQEEETESGPDLVTKGTVNVLRIVVPAAAPDNPTLQDQYCPHLLRYYKVAVSDKIVL